MDLENKYGNLLYVKVWVSLLSRKDNVLLKAKVSMFASDLIVEV